MKSELEIALFIALCKVVHYSVKYEFPVWKHRKNLSGDLISGTFLLGIGVRKGDQIIYELGMKEWESCWFAKELERAPEYDGHTSEDILKRLRIL